MNILDWINELNECARKGIKIFSIPELMNLSGLRSDTLRRTLVRLKEKNILRPIYQGLWGYGKDITLEDLFLKIDPDSYISLETVLGRSNILKSMSPDLTCISLTKSRTLRTNIGTLLFHKMKKDLFFGFDAMHVGSPEKALLDYLYLKRKSGAVIQWDKLDLSGINQRRLQAFLKRFPNFLKKTISIRNR